MLLEDQKVRKEEDDDVSNNGLMLKNMLRRYWNLKEEALLLYLFYLENKKFCYSSPLNCTPLFSYQFQFVVNQLALPNMLKNLITQIGTETSGRYCGTSRQTFLNQNCIPSLKNLHKKLFSHQYYTNVLQNCIVK